MQKTRRKRHGTGTRRPARRNASSPEGAEDEDTVESYIQSPEAFGRDRRRQQKVRREQRRRAMSEVNRTLMLRLVNMSRVHVIKDAQHHRSSEATLGTKNTHDCPSGDERRGDGTRLLAARSLSPSRGRFSLIKCKVFPASPGHTCPLDTRLHRYIHPGTHTGTHKHTGLGGVSPVARVLGPE